MKPLTYVFVVLSLIESLARLVPISSETLWPAALVAHEISPWFAVLNLGGALLAYFYARPAMVVFAAGLGITLWPTVQISGVEKNMASQWNSQGLSADALRVPGTAEIFGRSLTDLKPLDFAPQILRPDIYLYETEASGRRPILINIHGGSWKNGGPGEDGVFSSYMARQGYAVFSIDYRRAPVFHFPVQIDDVRAVIDWIQLNAGSYGADPLRIALAGRSAGGHLAMLAGYTSKIPIRAVVSFYGPPDLKEGYEDLPSPDPLRVRTALETFIGGSPGQFPEAYRDASPVNYVHKGVPATLQIQGGQDHIVKPLFPRELHQKLLNSGTRSVLLEIPWAEHSFDFVYFGPGNQLAMAYVVPFLAEAMR